MAFAPTAHAQSFVSVFEAKPTDPILSNCWLLVQSVYPQLKNTSEVHTGDIPTVGTIAVFQYPGEMHYAIVTKLDLDGFWVRDSNFGGAGIRTHFIEWSNSHIRGFYNPAGNSG